LIDWLPADFPPEFVEQLTRLDDALAAFKAQYELNDQTQPAELAEAIRANLDLVEGFRRISFQQYFRKYGEAPPPLAVDLSQACFVAHLACVRLRIPDVPEPPSAPTDLAPARAYLTLLASRAGESSTMSSDTASQDSPTLRGTGGMTKAARVAAEMGRILVSVTGTDRELEQLRKTASRWAEEVGSNLGTRVSRSQIHRTKCWKTIMKLRKSQPETSVVYSTKIVVDRAKTED